MTTENVATVTDAIDAKTLKEHGKTVSTIKVLVDDVTKAEISVTKGHENLLIGVYDALQPLDANARKWVSNEVYALLSEAHAKRLKQLVNKLFKEGGLCDEYLKANANKTAADFIKENNLGSQKEAQAFQTRNRQASTPQIAVTLKPVPAIEKAKEEVKTNMAEEFDYLDQDKVGSVFDKAFEAITKLYYADSAENMLSEAHDEAEAV